MKKLIILLTIFISLIYIYKQSTPYSLLPTPHKAFAHFPKTDGNITAIMHIDPEDDPIVGQQAAFYFQFTDTTNQFKPTDCDCTITILKHDKPIYSQLLFRDNTNPSLNNASIIYTFPERNVYNIKITGKPFTHGKFQPFTLTYDIRADRTATNQPAKPQDESTKPANIVTNYLSNSTNIIITLILFAVLTIFAIIQKQKTKGGD